MKFSRSRQKNPDFSDISCRSDEILTGSGQISTNPMRFPLDLAKSHRIRWDFLQIWVFLAIFSYQWHRSTHPPLVEGLICLTWLLCGWWQVRFSTTQLHWVGSRLGKNPTHTDSWIALLKTHTPSLYRFATRTIYIYIYYFWFINYLFLHWNYILFIFILYF